MVLLASLSGLGQSIALSAPADSCTLAVEETLAEFRKWDEAIPIEVARPRIHAINGACADPAYSASADDADAVIKGVVGGIGDAISAVGDKICGGTGVTAMGWADYVHIAGNPFHLANSPASSESNWFDAGAKKVWLGYARSIMDDFTGTGTWDQPVYRWFWMDLPMGGEASTSSSCTLGIVTSTSFALSGNVLGLGGNILRVSAGGTTCLVPC